jgi:hypothetical protein
MARDEAMMFPNERIKSWLANNRAGSEETPESPDQLLGEELTRELDAVETLESDVLR